MHASPSSHQRVQKALLVRFVQVSVAVGWMSWWQASNVSFIQLLKYGDKQLAALVAALSFWHLNNMDIKGVCHDDRKIQINEELVILALNRWIPQSYAVAFQ